jgi:protein N-terminal amidase
LAARVQCHVLAGYPERLAVKEIEDGVDSDGNIVTKNGANSAVLYGPDGRYIGNYRKSNLFETDTTWAKAGCFFLLPRYHLTEN